MSSGPRWIANTLGAEKGDDPNNERLINHLLGKPHTLSERQKLFDSLNFNHPRTNALTKQLKRDLRRPLLKVILKKPLFPQAESSHM